MNIFTKCIAAGVATVVIASAAFSQEAPLGSPVQPTAKEQKALDALKGAVTGKIVWSSSRSNSRHKIWIMNADGTDPEQLTKGDNVDWFARFSPDGSKVLFVRSKMGWVPENDAEMFDKWDLWTIGGDGTGEKKIVEDACWGTWRPTGDSVVFARGSKVFIRALAGGDETLILDAEQAFKKGTFAQQPELSPDGRLLAITLRGTSRETGIWNREKKVWNNTGAGCEISWFPNGKRVVRMNEGQGNGGTEVLAIDVDNDGKPLEKMSGLALPREVRFMDLPGRRSHEYFPSIDRTGQYMVWGSTQYGHEHDIVDYEIYIWKIGTDKNDATRLTFHTGNDRWPDLFIGTPSPAAPSGSPATDTVRHR